MGQLKRRLSKMKLDTEYFAAMQMIVVIVTFCGGLSYCSFILYVKLHYTLWAIKNGANLVLSVTSSDINKF